MPRKQRKAIKAPEPQVQAEKKNKEEAPRLLKRDCLYQLGPKKVDDLKVKPRPQAQQILDILARCGPIRYADLLSEMETQLESRQSPNKILSYYQSGLVAAGLLVFQRPYR